MRGGQHAKFSIRSRTFAYYLNDHHGDGRVAINCKAPPGQLDVLVASDQKRFFVPSYLGPKGWIGMYLDRGRVDWGRVAELVTDSYRMVAPRKLAEKIE